jgi:hypothetical protein
MKLEALRSGLGRAIPFVGGMEKLMQLIECPLETSDAQEAADSANRKSDIHIDGMDNETIAKLVESFPNIDFRSANDRKSHYDHQRKIGLPPNAG